MLLLIKQIVYDIFEPFLYILPDIIRSWWINLQTNNKDIYKSLRKKHKKHKRVLVLDLDETLIHTRTRYHHGFDLCMDIQQKTKRTQSFYIFKRPYLSKFLYEVNELFDVCVYTASCSEYADPVIDLIDTHGIVSLRLFRESCIANHTGGFVKDLSIIATNIRRDLRRIILIDNSAEAYAMQPKNALPIPAWYFEKNDYALMRLLPILRATCKMHDVRNFLQFRTFTRHEINKLFNLL